MPWQKKNIYLSTNPISKFRVGLGETEIFLIMGSEIILLWYTNNSIQLLFLPNWFHHSYKKKIWQKPLRYIYIFIFTFFKCYVYSRFDVSKPFFFFFFYKKSISKVEKCFKNRKKWYEYILISMLISMIWVGFFSTKICHNKGRFTLKKKGNLNWKWGKESYSIFQLNLVAIYSQKFLCVLSYYMFFYIILGSIISYLISNKWLKRITKS